MRFHKTESNEHFQGLYLCPFYEDEKEMALTSNKGWSNVVSVGVDDEFRNSQTFHMKGDIYECLAQGATLYTTCTLAGVCVCVCVCVRVCVCVCVLCVCVCVYLVCGCEGWVWASVYVWVGGCHPP